MSANQRLCYCPECGVVYFTKQTNCFGHIAGGKGATEDYMPPLLVDLDAELLLR